ncbi:efflux RND transporter permease subunit [Methanocella sp. MCL-LM]|uniref:efflux RND transporter permease subunit n=1 Tax=Methanocella sp. MCL-LM TaxID=3412035 RepID=UPI003C74BAD6
MVIGVWVLILILMAPLALNLSDTLKYDATNFMPKDTDSSKAQKIYDTQFPAPETTQLIVVVESDNRTAASDFIRRLNATVVNDSSIVNLSGTTSLCGMQRAMLVNMTPELHEGLYAGYENISEANFEMYNATDTLLNSSEGMYDLKEAVLQINDQIHRGQRQMQQLSSQLYAGRDQLVSGHDGMYQLKAAPDMIYGVPHNFVSIYQGRIGAGDNDSVSSETAYNAMSSQVSGPASGYLAAFYGAWNSPGISSITSPDERARAAIQAAFPQVLAGISDPAQRAMFQAAYAGMSYDTYSPAAVKAFCVNTAMAQGNLEASYKPQLEAVYDLGPNPSSGAYDQMVLAGARSMPGVTDDQFQAVKDVYYMGRNPHPGTIADYLIRKAKESTDDPDAKQLIQEAWDLGNPTEEEANSYVLKKITKDMNESETATVKEIYGWGPKPNNSTVADYVLRKAMEGKNASENQTIMEIYSLGRNASNESVKAYVVGKIIDSMNTTGGDNSYFFALLDLDRNLSDSELEAFAGNWADTHDYNSPKMFPDQITKSLTAGNVTLYLVTLDADNTKDDDLINADIGQLRKNILDLKAAGDFSSVNAYVTGSGAMSTDTEAASMNDISNIDKFTILVVLVLLLLYFRSILTPFVPLAAIGVAIVSSMGALTIISHYMDLYYIIQTLIVVIMMGAGIDYCVFMLSRYVEERREGKDKKAAVITMVEHAGKSIASSGLTAALGFGALIFSGQGMFTSIGVGVSIGLIVSMITALTLIPAVLMLVGDRLFWPNKIFNVKPSQTLTGFWDRLTGNVLKHSKVIVALAVLLAVPAIFFAAQLSTGMDMVSMLPDNVESKTGYDVLEESMGSSLMGKVMITATLPVNLTDDSGNQTVAAMNRIENISAMVGGIHGVDKVYSMTRPDGATITYDNLTGYSPVEKAYYEKYMDNATGLDGRTTVIYASFNGSPYSNEAFHAIDEMRAMLKDNSTGALENTEFHVGGSPAMTRDVEAANINGFMVVLPIVIVGILLILIVLLRSVFLPFRILVTLSLSICMTLAAYVIVYQIGQGATMIFMLPMMLFCALMGMGVDYDIFLVTRILEEKQKGKSDREAIKKAISSTGLIILICSFIMAGAFGTLMLSSMQMMQQIGFALSAGVLIDATLMLMIVVPAVMILMGKWNWWWPFGGQRSKDREAPAKPGEDKVAEPAKLVVPEETKKE